MAKATDYIWAAIPDGTKHFTTVEPCTFSLLNRMIFQVVE